MQQVPKPVCCTVIPDFLHELLGCECKGMLLVRNLTLCYPSFFAQLNAPIVLTRRGRGTNSITHPTFIVVVAITVRYALSDKLVKKYCTAVARVYVAGGEGGGSSWAQWWIQGGFWGFHWDPLVAYLPKFQFSLSRLWLALFFNLLDLRNTPVASCTGHAQKFRKKRVWLKWVWQSLKPPFQNSDSKFWIHHWGPLNLKW